MTDFTVKNVTGFPILMDVPCFFINKFTGEPSKKLEGNQELSRCVRPGVVGTIYKYTIINHPTGRLVMISSSFYTRYYFFGIYTTRTTVVKNSYDTLLEGFTNLVAEVEDSNVWNKLLVDMRESIYRSNPRDYLNAFKRAVSNKRAVAC